MATTTQSGKELPRNTTYYRIQLIIKALENLKNLENVSFHSIDEDSEVYDTADRPVINFSESFGYVMWALEVTKLSPKRITMGDPHGDYRFGLNECYILKDLRRSLSRVEELQLDVLLEAQLMSAEIDGGDIGKWIVRAAGNLKSLKILHLSFSAEIDTVLAFAELGRALFLPLLEEISLTSLFCRARDLANLLRKHFATLRKFSVCWITFMAEPDGEGELRKLLQDIQTTSNLEFVSLKCMSTENGLIYFPGMTSSSCSDVPNEDGFLTITCSIGVVRLESKAEVQEGFPRLLDCMTHLQMN